MSGSGMIDRRIDFGARERAAAEAERDLCVKHATAKAAKLRKIGDLDGARHLEVLAGDLKADFHHDEGGDDD